MDSWKIKVRGIKEFSPRADFGRYQIDFMGLDTCLSIMQILCDGLGNDKYHLCPLLVEYVALGRLGKKPVGDFTSTRHQTSETNMTDFMKPPPFVETPEDIKDMPFEKAMAELESLVRRLEEGRLTLEDAIRSYERGTSLRTHCEAKLRAAKLKVEQILGDPVS